MAYDKIDDKIDNLKIVKKGTLAQHRVNQI